VSWIDSGGNLWLFGGYGYPSSTFGFVGHLNDLWKYTLGTGNWTWMSGGSGPNQPSVYGTLGTAASPNVPGARSGSSAWIDGSGNLWLFGGNDSGGYFNNLWKYNPTTGYWTWMSGSSTCCPGGTYGTVTVAAPANVPGVRSGAGSWIDGSGNLWLFGGFGYGFSTNQTGPLNDLWTYNPSTGDWTWMSGSNQTGAAGTYGLLGTAAASNVPGSRNSTTSWIDSNGRLWMFGGIEADIVVNYLNDLWRYQP
jgi:hypothetical protein